MDSCPVIWFERDGLVCTFDRKSGILKSVTNGNMKFSTDGLIIDVGIDESYRPGWLKYHALDGLQTWELPPVVPERRMSGSVEFLGHSEHAHSLQMNYAYADLSVSVEYRICGGTLEIDAVIKNTSPVKRTVGGVAFIVNHAMSAGSEVTFEFPGNVPHPVFSTDNMDPGDPLVQAGLVNPLIQACSEGNRYNLLFIDEEEKWSTGVYKESEQSLVFIHNAGVECEMDSGAGIRCGTLYLQLIGQGDPFPAVRSLYADKGWRPPADGIRDGVLYSCHPHGTMDAGFPDRRTMREFAEELPRIKEMGIDHLWVMPIFEHLDRGVYHPTDQAIIDPRYGDDEDVRFFSRKTHELGMTLLFDYVPHGPELEDPLGIELRRWASVNREGLPVIEWNCLSFDMANPEYQAYVRELVQGHVDRFDIDGSRIDCAMGGLTNWSPYPGNRPSSSNFKGGAAISRVIREAFLDKGKRPLVTPENFNPVPLYAPFTDVFYDMALYRVLFELENAGLPADEYAGRLTRWLDHEMCSTPQGYLKLRFLGNHDTVTWVWQKQRAATVYGVEKAKALWALMSLIDGIPMIYQGDEDPSICRTEGPVLRSFFTELFDARKRILGSNYDIEYLYTGTPVIAFYRTNGNEKRLVSINLSPEEAGFEAGTEDTERKLIFGCAVSAPNAVKLDGYGYAIFDIKRLNGEAGLA